MPTKKASTKKAVTARSDVRKRPEESRPKRVPLSQHRNILTTEQRKGYVRRWVNDVENRVQLYLNAGWSVVKDEVQVGDEGVVKNNQSLGSGATKYVGAGRTAVLMEIEESFYLEDQEAKQAELDKTEEALWAQAGAPGNYGEIKIER